MGGMLVEIQLKAQVSDTTMFNAYSVAWLIKTDIQTVLLYLQL
jgi:hypothetical protein